MGLKGDFPLGIEDCTSLTGLDLSGNNFGGPIPSNISKVIPDVTTLDLSDNNFSGVIPENLANCSYLNDISLDHNQFSGSIPLELADLARLKNFNVANNNLSGPIPRFSANVPIPIENYANNPGLCGPPLKTCSVATKSHTGVIAGGAAGGFTLVIVVAGIAFFYISRMKVIRKKMEDPEGNRWTKTLKGVKAVKVSMFEKSASKMRLADLMKATNNFSNNNIINSGRTGAMYKAVMPDGTFFAVKRLQDSQRTEKEFLSEMNTLGSVRHQNLVPLLGYCVAKKEKFLVYRYMANGNLYDQLHPSDPEAITPEILEWPIRLKIAIGAAKGLAWMHHNCNPRILHRNISSKCILLDENFDPRLSDFGLARLMNPIDTHLSTFVNGEFGDLGYVAPEYARTLVATPKGDVFSFGTVLLELITGEKATQVSNAPETFKGNLVEWIYQLSVSSDLHSSIDKHLREKGVDKELFQFLRIACNCVTLVPKERPSMFEVYQLLRAIGEKYHFTADDEIMIPRETSDANFPHELIVSREDS
ncbi:probably inactive leucine-rich repeat receptor-like protein kinase At5g48380 isoform X2 [Silene latifolia]